MATARLLASAPAARTTWAIAAIYRASMGRTYTASASAKRSATTASAASWNVLVTAPVAPLVHASATSMMATQASTVISHHALAGRRLAMDMAIVWPRVNASVTQVTMARRVRYSTVRATLTVTVLTLSALSWAKNSALAASIAAPPTWETRANLCEFLAITKVCIL